MGMKLIHSEHMWIPLWNILLENVDVRNQIFTMIESISSRSERTIDVFEPL